MLIPYMHRLIAIFVFLTRLNHTKTESTARLTIFMLWDSGNPLQAKQKLA
jgi:hypothetical protein